MFSRSFWKPLAERCLPCCPWRLPWRGHYGRHRRDDGSGPFWVLFALLFWVLLVASLVGIRIIVWVFDAAQRR